MPQRATSIRIAKPCAESWVAMTPTGPGRRCDSCQKLVVDFTQKTDAEILAYFRRVGAGRTCGRFQVGQLERPLCPARPVARPLRWQLWVAGLLAAALSVQSCQTITGEAQPTASRRIAPPPLAEVPAVDSTTVGDIQTLTGDSVVVSAAPDLSGQLDKAVLGEPEIH